MDFWTRDDWMKSKPEDYGHSNCPFCDRSKTPLIQEFTHWFVCHNKYPYGNNPQNILLVPKKHRKYTYELTSEEFWELPKIEKFISEFYKWESYFSFIRQTYGGRSLEHLHYHYLPWIFCGSHVEHILEQNKNYSWKQ